ncbi:MAG: response regulator [Thermoanaerobaculia bacterium]|nr:response regulator [Thermoanaerobaculia bacterium]
MASKHFTILVIEDDPSIRRLVTTLVISAGFDVVEASTGLEAIRMLDEYDYPVIVLDLMLPGLSGFEVLDLVAEKGCESCVIVMTALSDDSLQDLNRNLVFDVVYKPFDLNRFKEVIIAAADERRRRGARLNLKQPKDRGPARSAEPREGVSDQDRIADDD